MKLNDKEKHISIAIDGPSGAGKSTLARILSEELGYLYIDTGALYRAVGYAVIENKKDTKNLEAIKFILPNLEINFRHINGEQRVFLNGEDISDLIRSAEMSMAASNVSAFKEVRDFLFDLQRNVAKNNNIVMDGRDIGTVVLPDADLKIFLTATAEDRARRRFEELLEKGIATKEDTFENVLADVKKRDYNDSHRKTAPLKQAEDAILVDTTGESLEESIARLKIILKENLKV